MTPLRPARCYGARPSTPPKDGGPGASATPLRTRSGYRSSLQTELGETGVIVRTATQRPPIRPIRLGDREIVDARDPPSHEPVPVERPVLVAVRAEPMPAVVAPLV